MIVPGRTCHTPQPPSPRNSTCFQQSGQKACMSATIAPQPGQRGGSAKSSAQRPHVRSIPPIIRRLSRGKRRRTSGGVPLLFDPDLRAMRRDRAARAGAELFLYERAFADCLERIALMQRRFGDALLIGCPDPAWPGLFEREREALAA